jgi:hypothetical protein
VQGNDAQQHHHALTTLQGTDFSFLPRGVADVVSAMMQLNVQFRSTTADIVSNSYFVTGTQAVLNMVETMHTRLVAPLFTGRGYFELGPVGSALLFSCFVVTNAVLSFLAGAVCVQVVWLVLTFAT